MDRIGFHEFREYDIEREALKVRFVKPLERLEHEKWERRLKVEPPEPTEMGARKMTLSALCSAITFWGEARVRHYAEGPKFSIELQHSDVNQLENTVNILQSIGINPSLEKTSGAHYKLVLKGDDALKALCISRFISKKENERWFHFFSKNTLEEEFKQILNFADLIKRRCPLNQQN